MISFVYRSMVPRTNSMTYQLILKTAYKNIHIVHKLPLKVNKTLFMQNKG